MKITIIGVVPPCPRCKRMYDLTVEAVQELGIQAEIKKLLLIPTRLSASAVPGPGMT